MSSITEIINRMKKELAEKIAEEAKELAEKEAKELAEKEAKELADEEQPRIVGRKNKRNNSDIEDDLSPSLKKKREIQQNKFELSSSKCKDIIYNTSYTDDKKFKKLKKLISKYHMVYNKRGRPSKHNIAWVPNYKQK